MAQRQTTLDRSMRPAAQDLIQTFGKQITFRRAARIPRPGLGDVSSTTSTTQQVIAYVAERSGSYSDSMGNSESYGLEVWVDDKSLSWVPDVGDEVILGVNVDTPVYSVDGVQEVFSGELIAIYKIDIGL